MPNASYSRQPPILAYIFLIFIAVAVGLGGLYVYQHYVPSPGTTVYYTTSNGQVIIGQSGTTQTLSQYYGTVIITATSLWAYDGSAQTYTAGVLVATHMNGQNAGTLTQATSTFGGSSYPVTMTAADNGQMNAIYESGLASETAFFVDPALTQALSGGAIKSWNTLTDINNDGQPDITFVLNIGNPAPNGNNAPNFQFNIYGWKQATSAGQFSWVAVSGTTSTSTGYHTAGTYTISGYAKEADGVGYEVKLAALRLWASDSAAANASFPAALFANNGLQLTGFSFGAPGANAIGTLKPNPTYYGGAWGTASIQGFTTQAMPAYDPSNTRWVFFAAPANSLEQSMPIVFERGSGLSWASFNINFQSFGGPTSSSRYNLFIEGVVILGAAAQTSEGLKLSFVG